MHTPRQRPLLASLCLIASLLLPTPTASAAESIPELQYPAIPVGRHEAMVSGPNGSVTLACSSTSPGVDLATYNNTGAIARKLDRTQMIDGVPNCITKPVVDKNGTLYGIPYGKMANSVSTWGPNLLAYSGNDLKWKYPVSCGSNNTPVAVGANGNIYTTQYMADGPHLIGLTPNVAPPLTQPAKILDVKIADDCSVQFFPYRDGLLLRGQNSGFNYYSYTGKPLAKPQVNRFWDAKVGASGELYDTTTGSFNSLNVTMYSPRTGQRAWATVASTPGAGVESSSLYPLAGGGVAALIKEQKMTSDGVPATPTTYIFTLAVLNPAGQKVNSVEVPGRDASGNVFANHRIVSSDNGKLAVVSDVELRPSYASAISVRVFDVATGSWTYQQIMSGDLSKAGGPSGFYLDRGPAISDNTLFLIGQCSGNCNVYQEKKLYALKTPVGQGLDYPRATLLFPRPSSPYVALGDSFSAGDSVVPFEPDTELPFGNECHRSTIAYPQLIAGSSPRIPAFGAGGFRACSGAMSKNIWEMGQWNEDIQLGAWPDTSIQLVTLTLGGNDIAFGDFGRECVLGTCKVGSPAYNTSMNLLENQLPGKLQTAYRKILEYAPNAKLYVAGYPHVVNDKAPSDLPDDRCAYLYDLFDSDHWKDAHAARQIVTKLNEKIEAAVRSVQIDNPGRLQYIPLDNSTSVFNGHEICGPLASWFQNVNKALENPGYVFHPNSYGQQGYATMISVGVNN